MSGCQAILLDMDGTLVDAFAPIVHALNRTLEAFGLPSMTELEIKRHTGRGECSMISLFGDRRHEAAEYFLRFHDERMFDIRPLPGAEALLGWLRIQQVPVALVTSKSQSRAEIQLEHLGWSDYFDAVIGLTAERRQKPDPHTLRIACEAIGIDPSHATMIGDGTADMKAACAAGAQAVGLVGHFSAEELRQAGAQLCFSNLNEVRTWLKTTMH